MVNIVNRKKCLRNEKDFYQTPYSLTRLLLEKEKINGSILEPACGKGAICKVLDEFGYKYDNYDIEKNFFFETKHYDTIITNPPYTLASEFIKKALEISDRFIYLLPLNYLHGKKRFDEFYNKNILEKVYIFTRYPLLTDKVLENGNCKTGMIVYAWYIFNKNNKNKPIIEWLDNNQYVY